MLQRAQEENISLMILAQDLIRRIPEEQRETANEVLRGIVLRPNEDEIIDLTADDEGLWEE